MNILRTGLIILFTVLLAACSGELHGETPDGEVATQSLSPTPETSNSVSSRSEGSGEVRVRFADTALHLEGQFSAMTSAANAVRLHYRGTTFTLRLNADAETEGRFTGTLTYDEIADAVGGITTSEIRAELKSGSRALVMLTTDENPEGELFAWVSSESNLSVGVGVLQPHPRTAEADVASSARGSVSLESDQAALELQLEGSVEGLSSAVTGAQLTVRGVSVTLALDDSTLESSGAFSATLSVTAMLEALAEAGVVIDTDTLFTELTSGNAAVFSLQTELNAEAEVFAFIGE